MVIILNKATDGIRRTKWYKDIWENIKLNDNVEVTFYIPKKVLEGDVISTKKCEKAYKGNVVSINDNLCCVKSSRIITFTLNDLITQDVTIEKLEDLSLYDLIYQY